jgi:hypothetical protein
LLELSENEPDFSTAFSAIDSAGLFSPQPSSNSNRIRAESAALPRRLVDRPGTSLEATQSGREVLVMTTDSPLVATTDLSGAMSEHGASQAGCDASSPLPLRRNPLRRQISMGLATL